MSRSTSTRIAVLVDTSTAWGRRLIHGVLAYEKMHGRWDVWLEPRGQKEPLRLPKGWKGNGIIARVSTSSIADKLSQLQVPVVNVSGIRIEGVNFPRVCTDNDKFAEVAVNHFVDRGLVNIAYIGLQGRAYSMDRQLAVARACDHAHCRFEAYRHTTKQTIESRWDRDRASIGSWLQSTLR